MTEEYNKIAELMQENGITITSPQAFIQAGLSTEEINELVEKIVDLKAKIMQGDDIDALFEQVKIILKSINDAKDILAAHSEQNEIRSLIDALNRLQAAFGVTDEYLDAQKEVDACKKAIEELEEAYNKLNPASNPVDVLKIAEERPKAAKNLQMAKAEQKMQENNLRSRLSMENMSEARQTGLNIMGAIETLLRNNQFAMVDKSEFEEVIKGINLNVALLGIQNSTNRSTLNSLCEEYGLEVDIHKEERTNIVPKQENPEGTKTDSNIQDFFADQTLTINDLDASLDIPMETEVTPSDADVMPNEIDLKPVDPDDNFGFQFDSLNELINGLSDEPEKGETPIESTIDSQVEAQIDNSEMFVPPIEINNQPVVEPQVEKYAVVKARNAIIALPGKVALILKGIGSIRTDVKVQTNQEPETVQNGFLRTTVQKIVSYFTGGLIEDRADIGELMNDASNKVLLSAQRQMTPATGIGR